MNFKHMIRDLFIAIILSAIVVGVMVGMPGDLGSAFNRFDSDLNLSTFLNQSKREVVQSRPAYVQKEKVYASAGRVGARKVHLRRTVSYNDPRVSQTADLPWVR